MRDELSAVVEPFGHSSVLSALIGGRDCCWYSCSLFAAGAAVAVGSEDSAGCKFVALIVHYIPVDRPYSTMCSTCVALVSSKRTEVVSAEA